MSDEKENKRRYKRYNTEIDVYFDFAYDLETKIKFELIDKQKKRRASKKYQGISKNISAEGLCFVSGKDVKPGDLLQMELFLPNSSTPISMKGEVRWHKQAPPSYEDYGLNEKESREIYLMGVQLLSVFNEPVRDSVHYDKEYEVNWSVVLESVFGSYKMLMGEKYKKKKK